MRQYPRLYGSLSLRLSLYILIVTITIFAIASVVTYHTARNHVQREIVDHAQVALDNAILQVSSILHDVEATVEGIAPTVEESVGDAEAMYDITRQILESNPYIAGSAIAFEPHYYPDKGYHYAPYSFRCEGEICTKQLGTEAYDYHLMEWYSMPKDNGAPQWSEPYHDNGGAEILITTFSYPLRDTQGVIYAILTADISIEVFANDVKSIKLYPGAHNFMISRHGLFLAHSRIEALHDETIFENAKRFGEDDLNELGLKMINGERSVCTYVRNDTEYYVLYAPIETTGWSMAVACPYVDVFAGVYDMRNAIIIIFMVGIITLTILSFFTIRRLTRPLNQLSTSASEIAAGNFSTPIPEVRGRDEMRQLRDSFELMRQSLIDYIDELRSTTALKERMESDLRIARDIQLGMLPNIGKLLPYTDKIDIAASLTPAKAVGGDLYNLFIKHDKLYFIVGDVSGKGVPAALLMAVICRMFSSVADSNEHPEAIMSLLNKTLAENNDSNMFCTAFIGIVDLNSGVMEYCNAGHNPPLLFDNNHPATPLSVEPNIPLGAFAEYEYNGQYTTLKQGTSIYIYTDGVTEAEGMDNSLYGESRLNDVLNKHRSLPPERVVEAVNSDVEGFSRGCEQSDDITMLCITLKSAVNMSITLHNSVDELPRLASFIEEHCCRLAVASDVAMHLQLALEESVVNIIHHAYCNGEDDMITVELEEHVNELRITITDGGMAFDPTAQADVDVSLSAEEREIGGLGIFLIRQVMDSVTYRRENERNILTMVKNLNG